MERDELFLDTLVCTHFLNELFVMIRDPPTRLFICPGHALVWHLQYTRDYHSRTFGVHAIQWNLDFTIWQGGSKIISLNRDVVVNELRIYK